MNWNEEENSHPHMLICQINNCGKTDQKKNEVRTREKKKIENEWDWGGVKKIQTA